MNNHCWEAINCTQLFPVGRQLTAHDYSLLGSEIVLQCPYGDCTVRDVWPDS